MIAAASRSHSQYSLFFPNIPSKVNYMENRFGDIIAELKNNEEETITFFKGLNSEQLGMTVYPDDPGWSVKLMLAHLITIEGPMQWLFKDLLAGGPGSPEDFDLDRFNRTQPRKLDGLSLDELCDKFRSVRRETISMVEGMQDKDLDRVGRHAFHGQGKMERFIVWAYEHARLHLDDIRKILQ
jgi:hypothetical protein